jgi:hypothetical protein
METTFVISLVGTALWLCGLWFMSRSLRSGMVLQLASTAVFAVLNVYVGAYPGLVGAAIGVVIMVRTIRHARPRPKTTRHGKEKVSTQARELERVWSEALA